MTLLRETFTVNLEKILGTAKKSRRCNVQRCNSKCTLHRYYSVLFRYVCSSDQVRRTSVDFLT